MSQTTMPSTKRGSERETAPSPAHAPRRRRRSFLPYGLVAPAALL